MMSKIRINVGQVEVEFEGSEEFLAKELPLLLQNILSLCPAAATTAVTDQQSRGGKPLALTTSSIAAKLNVKGGADLLKAAAAHLAVVKGLATFDRHHLLKEMQSASSYYRKTYSNNLSRYLAALIADGFLIESAQHVYALEAKNKTAMERTLAQ